MSRRFHLLLVAFATLAACKPNTPPPVTEAPPSPPPVATPTDPLPAPDNPPPGAFVWPESVGAFGEGYPERGDPCRRLGETPVTNEYLDHTRDLVGCPGGPDSAAARALIAAGGEVVGRHEGVTMISIYAGERP